MKVFYAVKLHHAVQFNFSEVRQEWCIVLTLAENAKEQTVPFISFKVSNPANLLNISKGLAYSQTS